jgi:cupin fold WbuC family metalloprotein
MTPEELRPGVSAESPDGSTRRFLSRNAAGRILHAVVDTTRTTGHRTDVSPPAEWLQLSVIALGDGASMRPHTHNPRSAERAPASVTQEAWLVLRGSIQVSLYDEDAAFLEELTLAAGHILVTFYGGHAFAGAQPGTLLVECKNGPYEGRDYTAFEATRS